MSRGLQRDNLGVIQLPTVHLRNPQTDAPWVDLADRIALECVRRGVLLFVTRRRFNKIVPSLMIDRDALREAFEVIEAVLVEDLVKCQNP